MSAPVYAGIPPRADTHPLPSWADNPPGQTSPQQPLQRTVRILLECILVSVINLPSKGPFLPTNSILQRSS